MALPTYMNDREVAAIFAMSTPWVRGQRFKRAHGLPHILTIDAVYLGTSRRYLTEDVDRLARTLASGREGARS